MHVYQPLPDQTWSRLDTLRFELPTVADSSLWRVSVGVRCTNRIPYQDLWLVVEQRTDMVHRDTVHVIVTDVKGNWLDSGPILHDIEQPVTTLRLDVPEPKLLVYHIMRPFSVPGISEVGIKIEPLSAFQPVTSRIDTQ